MATVFVFPVTVFRGILAHFLIAKLSATQSQKHGNLFSGKWQITSFALKKKKKRTSAGVLKKKKKKKKRHNANSSAWDKSNAN